MSSAARITTGFVPKLKVSRPCSIEATLTFSKLIHHLQTRRIHTDSDSCKPESTTKYGEGRGFRTRVRPEETL
jgi:hypothetical protein